MRTTKRLWVLLLGVGAGCAAPVGEEIGGAEGAIATERPDGEAEIMGRRYLIDPEVTLASFATATFWSIYGGCSATMIGPNVLMTAAHCGAAPTGSAEFVTYIDGDINRRASEWYPCNLLYQTHGDTDLMLYHCENPGFPSPGDKHGWLDFDLHVPVVGEPVYSVWSNPVLDVSSANQAIYGEGTVTSTTGFGWYTPGPDGENNIALYTDLWSFPGSSGSSILSPSTHRILAGPVSTGAAGTPDLPIEAANRRALTIRDYLRWGMVDLDPADVNNSFLASMGLYGPSYRGPVDEDADWLFDVQEDIEDVRGENARGFYWLAFDSPRRNRLWGITGTPKADGSQRLTGPTFSWPAGRPFYSLRHRQLNLAAGRTYRVSFDLKTSIASSGRALSVVMTASGLPVASASVPTVYSSTYQRVTVVLRNAGSAPATLAFRHDAYFDGSIKNVQIVEEGYELDFDLHDERLTWRDPTHGTVATFIPTAPDEFNGFGGVASRAGSASAPSFTLENDRLAVVPGRRIRVCASVRAIGSSPSGSYGRIRLVDGSSVVADASFRPGTTASTVCTADVTPARTDLALMFGVNPPAGPGDFWTILGARFVVDDVRIENR